MTDNTQKIDPEQEQYAYAITRKLFWYTVAGTIFFSGGMILLWGWNGGLFWN